MTSVNEGLSDAVHVRSQRYSQKVKQGDLAENTKLFCDETHPDRHHTHIIQDLCNVHDGRGNHPKPDNPPLNGESTKAPPTRFTDRQARGARLTQKKLSSCFYLYTPKTKHATHTQYTRER